MTDGKQSGLTAATDGDQPDEPESSGCDSIIVAPSWEVDDHRDAEILDEDDYVSDPQWA